LRTAGALEARGYSNSRTIDVPKWKLIDWLAAASGPVLLVLGAVAGSAGKG